MSKLTIFVVALNITWGIYTQNPGLIFLGVVLFITCRDTPRRTS